MNDIHNLLREVNALHRDDWVVCVDYFLSGDSAVGAFVFQEEYQMVGDLAVDET